MFIPADVSISMHAEFSENYTAITKNTNNLMLFSADQKIEHCNKDFYGESIPTEVINPEHIFQIAAQGKIGALATHLGLIARYCQKYKEINYIIKLNAKTNINNQEDPISKQLWSVDDVINFKKNSAQKIRGVGYTIYLGSTFEAQMLQEAANIIYQAHKHGLVTILWMYIRGKNVQDDEELVIGASGIANSLGADFAKIKPPKKNVLEILKLATQTAGNTKIICSGEKLKKVEDFLKELHDQITVAKTSGNATGRNIFQRPLHEAIALTQAISAIVYENKNLQEAFAIFNSKI